MSRAELAEAVRALGPAGSTAQERGGAICPCLVIAAGLVLITVRGARDQMNVSSSLL